MKAILLITATAVAMALTPPAQAQTQRSTGEQIALGVAIAAIVGLALKHRKDDDRSAQNPHTRNNLVLPQPQPQRNRTTPRNRAALSADCIRRLDTPHGRVRLMLQRCLSRTTVHATLVNLPDHCFSRVRTTQGERRRGYRPRCLRRAGYSIE